MVARTSFYLAVFAVGLLAAQDSLLAVILDTFEAGPIGTPAHTLSATAGPGQTTDSATDQQSVVGVPGGERQIIALAISFNGTSVANAQALFDPDDPDTTDDALFVTGVTQVGSGAGAGARYGAEFFGVSRPSLGLDLTVGGDDRFRVMISSGVSGSIAVEVLDEDGNDATGSAMITGPGAYFIPYTSFLPDAGDGPADFTRIAGLAVAVSALDGEAFSSVGISEFATVPEPASLALLGLGGLMLSRRPKTRDRAAI